MAAAFLDFNETESPRPRYDADELSHLLANCADRWIPELFTKGKIVDGTLRLADISGRPPRKAGSCVIQLGGEKAGCWHDFDGNDGGGPLSTLQHATGLSGRELMERAAEIVGYRNGSTPPAWATKPERRQSQSHAVEIANIVAHAVLAAGSIVETYLAGRKLILPPCADLLFNANVTDFKSGHGRPAMVAIARGGDNAQVGLHRTYLELDGSGKAANMANPRKTLGEDKDDFKRGAAVQLFPITDGRLGVAEGIETAIAAAMIYSMPVWAALSTSGIMNFPIPEGVTELIVFADAGKAGIKAATALIDRAIQSGIKSRIELPKSGDDFNTDLMKGLSFPGQHDKTAAPTAASPEATIIPGTIEAVTQAACSLSRETPPAEITAVLRALALLQPDKVTEQRVMDQVKAMTRMTVPTLRDALKQIRRELGLMALIAPVGGGKTGMDWLAKMIPFESGEPKPILANVVTALRSAPEWTDVLWFDEFGEHMMMRKPPPWLKPNDPFTERRIEDDHDLLTTEWMQRAGIHVDARTVSQAISVIARELPYHPVRDYLDGLQWDRKPRLDIWASYYLGADDTPYARAVGARWMISAVARVYRPGAKVDCAVILEGPQGIKKSTALRILGEPWFTDDIAELGSKDAAMQTAGVWIVELAELASMRRGELNRVKAFISRTTEHFRPPFGRHIIDRPRQCVFAGSVNEDEWHDDSTGARRFWPLRCSSIDTDALWRDRNQLWAEAVYRYEQGERWYLHEPELLAAAAEMQEQRRQVDPWAGIIAKWMDDRVVTLTDTSVGDVLIDCLKIERGKMSKGDQMRVGSILKKWGWIRYHDRFSGTREWRYRAPEPESAEGLPT